MEFLKDYVPESFKNEILSVSFEPNNHFNSVIRANINNFRDCDAWVAEFGRNTKTKWIVRHTKPNAQRLICRKKYVCHHSDFQKKPNEVHGRKSKNFSCNAFINIRVKLTTLETKKKDKYIRDGLPAVITMNNYHSHDNLSAEVMSYLPPSDEVRASFEGYFNEGLGLKEAISVHEAKLKILDVDDLTDATLNPRYDTVKYWLNNWRKSNLRLEKDIHEPEDSDIEPADNDGFVSIESKDTSDNTFQKIIRLMKIQNDRFGTSPELVEKVYRRLRAVNSQDGWTAFLNSSGSSLLVHKRNRKSRSVGLKDKVFVDEDMSDEDICVNADSFVEDFSCEDLSNCILQI